MPAFIVMQSSCANGTTTENGEVGPWLKKILIKILNWGILTKSDLILRHRGWFNNQ